MNKKKQQQKQQQNKTKQNKQTKKKGPFMHVLEDPQILD
jgi:hypothetical protein